jgi:thiamine pyrophosphate-dependent acetolactate synthase large subunit-like protein
MPSGAEVLVRALERIGVDVVFGVPSRRNLPLLVQLRAQGVRVVQTHTVGGSISAADGYARRTGSLGVVLGGAATPLGDRAEAAEAVASEVPLLLIELDVSPPTLPGPPREVAAPATTPSRHVPRMVHVAAGDDVRAGVAHARDVARTSPSGPVVLQLAADVVTGAAAPEHDDEAVESAARPPAASVEHVQLRRAGNLVDAAQHVLIWAGGGALRAGAGGAVAELAEKLGAPVLTTVQAAGLLPARHPCLVGLPPHLPQVGALWDRADLVIAIGSDLDEESTQGLALPEPPTLVAINVDAVDAGRHYRPDVLLRGDARTLTKALADAISYRGGTAVVRSRLQEVRTAVHRDLADSDPHETAFLHAVAAALPDRATVVVDPCAAGRWLAGFHEWTLPRTLLHPADPDASGYAVPAAIGAAATGTTDPVVAIIGDQGLLACLGELAVVAREKLAMTLLVVDDGGAGRLRPVLAGLGLDPGALDKPGPDLAATARTFGLRADRIDVVGDELTAALRAHIAAPDPTVLVVQARLGLPPTDPSRWYRAPVRP